MELTEKIAAELIIDHLLQEYPNGVATKNIVSDNFPDHEKSQNFRRIVNEKLLTYELAEPASDPQNKSNLKLTIKGYDILSKMSLGEYEEKYKRDEEIRHEREQLSHQKTLLDLKNAKRVYKTYWWTFGIAIASLLISITLLFLRILEKG